MGKKSKALKPALNRVDVTDSIEVETGRGIVKDNALKAVVTSRIFRSRVEKAKKGKGSFTRKGKHRGKEPYSKVAEERCLNRVLFCSID